MKEMIEKGIAIVTESEAESEIGKEIGTEIMIETVIETEMNEVGNEKETVIETDHGVHGQLIVLAAYLQGETLFFVLYHVIAELSKYLIIYRVLNFRVNPSKPLKTEKKKFTGW